VTEDRRQRSLGATLLANDQSKGAVTVFRIDEPLTKGLIPQQSGDTGERLEVLSYFATRADDREKDVNWETVNGVKSDRVTTEQYGAADIFEFGELAESVRNGHAPSDAGRKLLLALYQQALNLVGVERGLAGLGHDAIAQELR
jgi:hypothetical protein